MGVEVVGVEGWQNAGAVGAFDANKRGLELRGVVVRLPYGGGRTTAALTARSS
jgi:hypothetical protein